MLIFAPDPLSDLLLRVGNLEDTISWYQMLFWGIGALAATAGVLGYKKFVPEWVGEKVDSKLSEFAAKEFPQKLEERLRELQKNAETHLLRLASAMALHSQKAYDDGLEVLGWSGQVAALRTEPIIVRKMAIECLTYAQRGSKEYNRDCAWQALNELAQDSSAADVVLLYLRTAVRLKFYDEGEKYYHRHKEIIERSRDSIVLAATLLRRQGRRAEAIELITRHRNRSDSQTETTLATLMRDGGRLDEAHDILMPLVSNFMRSSFEELDEGWHRAVNTYIALCIDRARASDAIAAGFFALRNMLGAVEVATVGRLVRELPSSEPRRDDLLNSFRAACSRLIPGEEAEVQSRCLLAEIEGRMDAAIQILRETLQKDLDRTRKLKARDRYFIRCALADLLLKERRFGEAHQELIQVTAHQMGGEGQFLLALYHAMRGEAAEASNWLSKAAEELPRWAERARHDPTLRALPEIQRFLAERARASSASNIRSSSPC